MFTLFTNGSVQTFDPARPRARSLLVYDDRVVAAFDDDEPELVLPGEVRLINLGGRCLLPGFTDSHIHAISWGLGMDSVDLSETRSSVEAARMVAEAAKNLEPGRAIVGAGWSHNQWPEGRLPASPAMLDAAAPGRVVVLHSRCHHLAWLSSPALVAAGVGATTPDPPGGVIDRDANGMPTGILKENACAMTRQAVPPASRADRREALSRAIKESHKRGVTAWHCVETLDDFACYQQANREGALGVRVHFYLPGEFAAEAIGLALQTQPQSGKLSIGGLKYFADGSLGGRTAWMLEPYVGEPGNLGVPIHSAEELREIAVRATDARLACAIHAIGDAAVRHVLDAYEHARAHEKKRFPDEQPLLHRIEHLQTAHPDDIRRCARLGVAAAMQPVHLQTDWAPADAFLGDERAACTYACHTALKAGVVVAFGSDAPVATVDVPQSLDAAVNRRGTDGQPAGGWRMSEAVTIHQALSAHTVAGARMAGDLRRRGRLMPRMIADLVILDRDPTEMPTEELPNLKIEATFVDGQCVHGNDLVRALATR